MNTTQLLNQIPLWASYLLTVLVLLAFLGFLLSIDLDRSNHGLSQVPQKALLGLQQQIRAQP